MDGAAGDAREPAYPSRQEANAEPDPCRTGGAEPSRPGAATRVRTAVLRSGQSPWRALRRLGVPGDEIRRIAQDFRPHVELRGLLPGHEITVSFSDKRRVSWVRHRPSPEIAWCGVRTADGYRVSARGPVVERRLELVKGVLLGPWTDSLEAVGAPRSLGELAATVFPVRKRTERNTSFRLIVERRYVDGAPRGHGTIELIELRNGERSRRAFRFPEAGDPYAYFHEKGRPIRLRRLPTPVPDGVLTSRFGRRYHPIRRRRKMHYGVDYGAPSGTAVYAVATGTVTMAGFRGRLGRLVALTHDEGLVTRYAHLQRIASGIAMGDRVQAGDLIGYVGSSGMSTGPHLHFETILHGRFVNPERVVPPPPRPLEGPLLERFRAKVARLLGALDDEVS